MGGKRPDQYRIAPDEAGATDYKNYPNEPGDIKARRRSKKKTTEAPWDVQGGGPRPQERVEHAESDENEDDSGDEQAEDEEK